MKQTTENIYREPGAGAIEFAKEIIGDMSRSEASEMMTDLKDGNLHDQSDKRIKRCNYCGYFWRDDSLRNTKKTCSDECKRGIKKLQRRDQREKQALLDPNPKPKKRKLADDYIYWLEYPYWLSEKSMNDVTLRQGVARKQEFIEFIGGKNEIYGEGNRKTKRKIPDI